MHEGDIELLKSIDKHYVSLPADVPESDARGYAEMEILKQETLFFLFASLDLTLPPEMRLQAAELVEEALEHKEVDSWIRLVISSEPLRASSEAFLLRADHLGRWTQLKQFLRDIQSPLSRLWRQLGEIEFTKLALGENDLDDDRNLLSLMLADGTVSLLAQALLSENSAEFNQVIVNFCLSPKVRGTFPTAAQAVNGLRGSFGKKALEAHENGLLFMDDLASDADGEIQREYSGLSVHEAYTQVLKQIEGIKRLLISGNISLMESSVADLISFHEVHSEPEHLAKSLCLLTKFSLDLNEPHIAMWFAEKAKALNVSDIVVQSSYAEVLKSLGRFSEAQSEYEAMLRQYGQDGRYRAAQQAGAHISLLRSGFAGCPA